MERMRNVDNVKEALIAKYLQIARKAIDIWLAISFSCLSLLMLCDDVIKS